jgi:hypothetical protein
MAEQLTIGVYRRLDDRLMPGYHGDDNTPEAWELHCRRRSALEDALCADPVGWRVVDWGQTKDETETHEFVELLVEILENVPVDEAASVALTWIGHVLGDAISEGAREAVKGIFKRLWDKRKRKEINDFSIRLGGKDLVSVSSGMLEGPGSLFLTLPNGQQMTASWNGDEDKAPTVVEQP